jgi:hypothetical protein
MTFRETLRRYWPEMLLALTVALPWISLMVLGLLWLWQGGRVWAWAIAAAVLGLPAIPLARLVRRRANAEARIAMGDLAEPSRNWNAVEREAWSDVLAIADTAAPFSFADTQSLAGSASHIIEVVARRFHPGAHSAWAQFSLPEALLLSERLCRDVRREALRHIPGIRTLRLSDLLWVHRQNERYGAGLRMGYEFWRLARAAITCGRMQPGCSRSRSVAQPSIFTLVGLCYRKTNCVSHRSATRPTLPPPLLQYG